MRNIGKTMTNGLGALVLSLLTAIGGPAAHASDSAQRGEITAMFMEHYASGDYSRLDAWYATALREGARLPSGIYRANRMVRSIDAGFGDMPDPPPCTKAPCPQVNDGFWTDHQERAKAWLKQNPKSTLAAITVAKAYSGQAWQYRGGGYANTVREEDMKKFHELNHQALRTIVDNAEYGRRDPNWWAELLIYLLYGQASRQDYLRMAREAIDAFPQNHDIYFAIAHGLLPQWGGGYEEIASLATLAVENTKVEQGQTFYARIYWSAYHGLKQRGAAAFTRPDVNWKRIRAGFEDLVKRYPDKFNLNAYARLACVAAKDKKTTAEVLQRIGPDLDPVLWEDRTEYARCKNWSQQGDAP